VGLSGDGRAPFRRSRSRCGLILIATFFSGSGAQEDSGRRSEGSIVLPWKSTIGPSSLPYGVRWAELGPDPIGVIGPLAAESMVTDDVVRALGLNWS